MRKELQVIEMSGHNVGVGKSGEEAAARFLKGKGYKILERNYRTKLGEIDIVAQDNDTLCFVEVKTRRTDKCGDPGEAVLNSKQRQISKAALSFLKAHNFMDRKARFDVVSILYSDNKPQLDLIKNAFELDARFSY